MKEKLKTVGEVSRIVISALAYTIALYALAYLIW